MRTALCISGGLILVAIVLVIARDKSPHDVRAEFRRPSVIPYPASNPFSEAKYQLGRTLFFDPRLSKSNMLSCASCHNPSFSWTDGLPKGVGHGHLGLDRKVPTILNAAWGWKFFWDGRAATLEEQALGPIQSDREMNLKIPDLVEKLSKISEYRPLFQAAFSSDEVTPDAIAKSIATFERTVVSDVAPFDRWVAGDENAISEEAKRGFAKFNEVGCVKCHTGWNFTNGAFADTGLVSDDLGRGKIEGNEATNHSFKTPTLRNVARRAPYMHDGSLPSLAAVIDHYDVGGASRRESSRMFVKPLNLSRDEKRDLQAFLETLTSTDERVELPLLPKDKGESWTPSGISASSF